MYTILEFSFSLFTKSSHLKTFVFNVNDKRNPGKYSSITNL